MILLIAKIQVVNIRALDLKQAEVRGTVFGKTMGFGGDGHVAALKSALDLGKKLEMADRLPAFSGWRGRHNLQSAALNARGSAV